MGMNDAPRCTYIKVTGHRCGSPAMKQEHFCFFHARMIKGVRYRADMQMSPAAVLEDAEAVQVGLMEIITELLERKIAWREASLVVRALEVAARNVRRVRFGQDIEKMVRELPNWPAQFFDEYPEHAPENWDEERKQVKGTWGHEPGEEEQESAIGSQESGNGAQASGNIQESSGEGTALPMPPKPT